MELSPRERASSVRASAIARLNRGELSTAGLVELAGGCPDVLYDLIELPYDEDDERAVDRVRAVALEAAGVLHERPAQE